MESKIVGRECRFAVHVPSRHSDTPDIHVVKEQVHYEDGTMKPNLRLVQDFKRPYWITQQSKRDHQQKKEWESLDNVMQKEVTQSKLRDDIARAIGKGWSPDPLKKLLNSPYIYGADITASSLIKRQYMVKWPTMVSGYTRCILDVESDVTRDKSDPGFEDILMTTVIFGKEIFISVEKRFLEGLHDVQGRLDAAVSKYIGEYVDKHQMKVTLHIADNVIDMLKAVFKKVHEWKPDWLAIWNISFDIPKIISMLEKYGIDPREVLCDPTLPMEYRICKWMPGPTKQVTASGKVKPINPASQWHTLRCTASYYVIDSMCVYKHLRLGEQEEPSYSLDWILQKILGIRKLKFAEADGLERLEWHKFMQTKFKIEYMVYNIFDCLSMLELDDKTKDLIYSLPGFAGTTDFPNFKSQPRRIMDNLHYYALEEGCVMGTVGYQEKVEAVSDKADDLDDDEEDDEEEENTSAEQDLTNEDDESADGPVRARSTLSLKRWIVTLPAHMSVLGLPLIKEDPSLLTNIRTFVYDSDEVSAYPTATTVANVSKGSTKREIIDVVGIKEMTFRYQNMNLLLGSMNALEYATTMFNFPKPDQLLEQFMRDGI